MARESILGHCNAVNQTELTELVKDAAIDCGFHAVGVAEAVPLVDPINRYQQWLDNGYHGMLQYMERNVDVRADVTRMLDGAQSVIVVAMNYYTDHQHAPEADGKISRYAWGDDYHDIMRPMLNTLCERIDLLVPGSTSRGVVDTTPVLEKEWAVRAGLGWQGKHTLVLRRDIGSWFFLGIVITTAKLVPDRPMDEFCGTCTACIDACPTQAIVQPNLLDATRCISYWTIEVKPEHQMPQEIVNGLEHWLFGCDICQEVCPWNRFQQPTTEPSFQPRFNVLSISPASLVDLQQADFVERFRKSPLKRPKLAGLQRNARTLMGEGAKDYGDYEHD
ncbi:MAG: tRNA epoxyqueuosine(34) reductase QueG [Bradyrhizobiaceae bacterium]|nr:tRNA epoxyqueuosine(34) reductase QueG [Bradyrhizobiaceae bacterium]